MEEVAFEEVCHLQGPEDCLSFEKVDDVVTGGLARMTQGTTREKGEEGLERQGLAEGGQLAQGENL